MNARILASTVSSARTTALLALAVLAVAGCSSSDSGGGGGGDTGTPPVDSGAADTRGDGATGDGTTDGKSDAPDTTPSDTGPAVDTGPAPDTGAKLVPCGASACNSVFEFCHVDTGATCGADGGGGDTAVDAVSLDTGLGLDVAPDDTASDALLDAPDLGVSDGGGADAPTDTASDTGGGGICGPRKCEAMPSDCFGFPSCTCLLNKLCGSPSAGACEESNGGYVIQCR